MRSMSQSWSDFLVERTQAALPVQRLYVCQMQSYRRKAKSHGRTGELTIRLHTGFPNSCMEYLPVFENVSWQTLHETPISTYDRLTYSKFRID